MSQREPHIYAVSLSWHKGRIHCPGGSTSCEIAYCSSKSAHPENPVTEFRKAGCKSYEGSMHWAQRSLQEHPGRSPVEKRGGSSLNEALGLFSFLGSGLVTLPSVMQILWDGPWWTGYWEEGAMWSGTLMGCHTQGLSGPAAPSPDSWAGEKAMAMRSGPAPFSKQICQ